MLHMYNIEVQEAHSRACTKLKKRKCTRSTFWNLYKAEKENVQGAHSGTCTKLKKKMFERCSFFFLKIKLRILKRFDFGNFKR